MFDANGDFIYDHDLESGLWDQHSYGCSLPVAPCDCGDLTDFGFSWIDDEGDFHEGFEYADDILDDDDAWIDLHTYQTGR